MKRLCPKGHIVTTRRCTACERQRDVRRGSRTERGYGLSHRRARASLAKTLPAYCGYGCGTWLTRDGDWIAAHAVDGDPSAGWLASCRGCNERAKVRPR